jgi:ectoine hydroxylase-related dioxygenase (phytanoyl-CoA dioxygenase family)
LAQEGWCVVPDVLTPAETGHALERLWAAAEATRKVAGGNAIQGLDPNEHSVRVFNLLQSDEVFRQLIQHPTALAFVREVLGPDFMISNFSANIARPGARSMALHSDQAIVAPEPWVQPWSVNIIWCFGDIRFENGATLYVPGSNKWRTRDDVPATARERLRAFEAKAGSIIVMEGRMWHTSGANITENEDRPLAFAYYSRSFLRPQVNWNAALPAELQAALSPQLRHWLGLEVTGNNEFAIPILGLGAHEEIDEVLTEGARGA